MLVIISWVHSARAIDPAITLERATIAGGVRGGTEDLNLGLGARAGYTIRHSVYFGGIFDYWFGESEESNLGGAQVSAKAHGWNAFGDVGYDLGLTPTLVLRPFGGAGVFHADAEICQDVPGSPLIQCIEASDTEAAGVFGGQIMFFLDNLHLGGEIRIMFAEQTAAVFAGNIGGVF